MKSSRRIHFAAAICVVAAIAAGEEARTVNTGQTRMNFVVIMADDVSEDVFGCYGAEDVKTPNIDRMADLGVQFKTAWATPLCSPTRVMIMTGRYANTTGFYHNDLKLASAPNPVRNNLTFGKMLRDAGYATAIAGKWHLTGDAPYSERGGFEQYSLWADQTDIKQLPGRPTFTGAMEDEKTPARYWHPAIIQNGKLLNTKADDFGPKIHTDFLCDFIRRNTERPFFAYFPMTAPHRTRQGITTTPQYGTIGDISRVGPDKTAERFRKLNEYIDFCVGRILATLEEHDLLTTTLVIFTSDNGTDKTAKGRGVERGARVPFVVLGGGIERRGLTMELTDLSDVMPTLLDFAGVDLPDGYRVDGTSLRPFLEGRTDTHREWIYSTIATTQMIRDKNWLLEAINPVLNRPMGRLYYVGDNRDGKGYRDVTGSNEPEVLAARKKFDEILRIYPSITIQDPRFRTRDGRDFLVHYRMPGAVKQHLFNHPDYEYELVETSAPAESKEDAKSGSGSE